MLESAAQPFVLGIDLGSNSLGWSIVSLVDGEPASLVRCGVRVFPSGVINEKGNEKSRNLDRRLARLQRRQIWRRARKMKKIFNLLQRFGLLPLVPVRTPQERQDFLNRLDREILASAWFNEKRGSGAYPEADQVMPYILRAAALDEPLSLHFVGRALYHLAQRRGFLSNRKKERRAGTDDDKGKVETGIRELEYKLQGRTLGQYLAGQSPTQVTEVDPADPLNNKVRRIWTRRRMYQEEFERIWTAQAKYYPAELTQERKEAIRRAMFDQRGPKERRSAIGNCEFEPAERRAAAHSLVSQRFRMLAAVNNLRVWRRGSGEQPRRLAADERAALIGILERKGDVDFKVVREIAGLSRYSFNLQKDKDHARMPGDNTGQQLYEILGEGWFQLDLAQRERIVADACSILSIRDERDRDQRAEKYLRNRGVQDPGKVAEQFLKLKFEGGRMNLSEKAMNRFLPLLERGFCFGDLQSHYAELDEISPGLVQLIASGMSPEKACMRLLVPKPKRGKPHDLLPPVADAEHYLGRITNPVVLRSLTELRKVVNTIIHQYGKPAVVRIELARELKNSKEERERVLKENNARERSNSQIIDEIKREAGGYSPGDLTRYKLWLESRDSKCPYCLEAMSRPSLFADGSLQVDHIIPRGRLLDDSFTNLVLCHAECNQRKGDRTPFEAFGATGKWDEMLVRSKGFGEAKLRRFKMAGEELDKFCDKFRSSQLNDTAYASLMAGDYLSLLFGGRVDAQGSLRVQVSSGGATKFFRGLWRLNGILNDGPTNNGGREFKSRDDHRHHAVDAAVIAVTDGRMLNQLNNAAKHAQTGRLFEREQMGPYKDGPLPGVSFKRVLGEQIERLIVSHRVSKKVSGALHKSTNYSPQEFGENIRRHRIALTDLTRDDVASDLVIPDKGVRELIRRKLGSLGITDPGEAFKNESNLPAFITDDGRTVPIKKVRIQETVKTRSVGKRARIRYVKPQGNHHLEIFGLPGPNGRDKKWDTPGVVTLLEAYERTGSGQPVVRQSYDTPGWEFRFSLGQNDTITFDAGPHRGSCMVVRSISEEERTGSVKIEMAGLNDARQKAKIKKSKQWITKSPNELLKWATHKLVVNPLGDISESHD